MKHEIRLTKVQLGGITYAAQVQRGQRQPDLSFKDSLIILRRNRKPLVDSILSGVAYCGSDLGQLPIEDENAIAEKFITLASQGCYET